MSKMHRDLLKTAVRTGSADAQELAVQAGPAAVPWLQRQMLNENSRIRLTAFYCLLRIRGPHIMDTCVRALYDTQPNIRAGAVREICEHGDCTHVKLLLDAYANSPAGRARDDIALTIGRLDSTFALNSLENSVAARCQDDLATNQLATKHLQEILRRGNLLAKRVTFSALNMATTFERLTPAHLCLRLCSRDWSLVIRTLRVAVDMKSFVKSLQDLANEKSQPGEIQTIFKLACAIAPADKPITTAHLLAAVLLDGTNKISRYLRDCHVDVRALVRKRLAHVLSGPLRSHAGAIEGSEMNARMWLLELIPNDGCDYLINGVIEIRSSLYPERVYRIYRDKRTEIFEHGRRRAAACIRTVDYKIPPTDRVLAEYFLLKGNERGYLRTAISTYL
jgi:hypothetical protein